MQKSKFRISLFCTSCFCRSRSGFVGCVCVVDNNAVVVGEVLFHDSLNVGGCDSLQLLDVAVDSFWIVLIGDGALDGDRFTVTVLTAADDVG